MKALSVRAPWWWFILHGGKDIENRDWCTGRRGTHYLHASKWWNQDEVEDLSALARSLMWSPHNRFDPGKLPAHTFDQIKSCGGCIVGKVDIVDCVKESTSPWFFGEYGFVLRNAVAFAGAIPWKGSLGFFDVPEGLGE